MPRKGENIYKRKDGRWEGRYIIRKIPIPEIIFQLLQKFNYPGNTYLLTGHKQKYIEPRTLQYRFKSILNS